MNKDLISVVMPVYNAERFLSQAIKSVLSQTYKNFEYIIVDDCSTDNSYQICLKFKKKDSRIKLFKNVKNMGVGFTLNQAISKSKGQYLARMDADDMMAPKRLTKQLSFLGVNTKVVCLGSWMKEIDEDNNIIGKRITPLLSEQIYETMFFAMGIQNPTLMINRKLVPKKFSWCKIDGILDDLDLLFRLLNYGKFANLNDYLMLYRIHNNNLSLSNIKKTFREAQIIRRKAVTQYEYKPTLKARVIFLAQSVIITITPEKYLYPLYKLFAKIVFKYV